MGGHAIARQYGAGLEFHNLRFAKKGSEIQKGIDSRIAILNSEIQKDEEIIKGICKTREIDPTEVLEAGNDESKIAAYSERYITSSPMKTRSFLEDLQKDFNILKVKSGLIVRKRVLIGELTLVKKNLEPDRSFDLTFDEICDLGF